MSYIRNSKFIFKPETTWIMKNKPTFNMEKELQLHHGTIKKSRRVNVKKSLPFLFSILMLFTVFTSKANFSNTFLGPNNAITGALYNYSYVFMTTPPTSYPVPVSARLDIVGGVFVSPQGTTTTTIYNPVMNGTTNFQVRWQTTGKITSTYTMGNIPYVSNNGQVSGTLVY